MLQEKVTNFCGILKFTAGQVLMVIIMISQFEIQLITYSSGFYIIVRFTYCEKNVTYAECIK